MDTLYLDAANVIVGDTRITSSLRHDNEDCQHDHNRLGASPCVTLVALSLDWARSIAPADAVGWHASCGHQLNV
jgi:hypothetical protein